MAIRGIDTQIMINRLPDNVRAASELLKRPEIVQDMLGAQSKINDAQEQNRVTKTAEAEMEQIRADVDEGAGNEYEGDGGAEHSGEGEEETNPDMLVPVEDHLIDIKI